MHFIYKLIALSVVFGLVLTSPAAKLTEESFDDLAYEATYPEPELSFGENEGSRTVDIVVPKVDVLSLAFGAVTKLAGLKTNAIAIAVKLIKWIVSKSALLAVGAVVAFAFCKLTDKCSLALAPAVYHRYVPAQVKDFVTPQRLEHAQQFLYNAMEQYAKENGRSVNWF